MKLIPYLTLLIILLSSIQIDAQSPCSTCSVNIITNNNSTYSLGSGQNMCISAGAIFSGTISGITSTSKICIIGNSSFTGSINNIPTGAQIYIESGSQFNPSGLYNIGGTITNNGSVSITTYTTVNAAFTIANTGTFNFAQGINMNSAFSINNSGTLNFANGFQSGSSAVTTIVNTNNFTIAGYTTLLAGSSITNSGIYTASAQQAYTGVTINNTAGQFLFTSSSNTISSSSVVNNQAYLSLNSFTLSGSSLTNSSAGTVVFQSTFTLANGCSFTNDGTANFKNNYQLDNGSTMTNNGNIQMNNGNTYLNTNGIFTNNGYVYVNGKVTFGGSSTVRNNCTIVAVNGFTNQNSNTQNYGYILIPLDSDPSNSLVTLEADFYNNTDAWVQGINFTHNGGTVKGSGNYFFSGTTINYNAFGNGSTPAANFYDATPTPGSPSSGMFDQGYGATSNTTKIAIAPVDINSRAGGCNAIVISQGSNTECSSSYNALPTTLFKNGSFSTAISNPTGNTYTSGLGTTYNFSGGSFISQMDYVSTGNTACARTNISTNGNGFSILTMGVSSTYTGSGNCSAANQNVFAGDAAYGIGMQPNFMYVAGNTLSGEEYLVYQQNLTGLTIGKSYTFYFYVSNLREVANNGVDPIIRIRLNGTDGLADGAVGYGPFIMDEATTQNSAALSGWKRISYNFTATATTIKIKITDAAFSSAGDEWGITAMGITECKNNDTDGDGVNDNDDVDDDNDGVLDVNEYGPSSQFVWSTSGTPSSQTVNGVTLTPTFRNPFGLTSTNATMTSEHTGNVSNDIKIISNPNSTTEYSEMAFAFSKSIAGVSFEINDIDARSNGANTWKDAVVVYAYKGSNAYTLTTSEYSLGTEITTFGVNGFVTTSTTNNLAQSSNNGRVIVSITDPVDSVVVRIYDNSPNKKDATIYISAIKFINPIDTDGDGIPDYLDLDSDNDGIPDVIENYGVDTNGDGIINCTFNATTGLANCLTSAGLTVRDFDGDGIPNFRDLDSDNDGMPDIIEVQGTDANNDGKIDNYIDNDGNGYNDAVEGSSNALLKSGSDTNGNGVADSWPSKNIDLQGYPNPYDLDSDGDGILDLVEAGLTGSSGKASGVDANGDGWSDTVDGYASLTLPNTDAVGLSNPYDIDSDNDGITDNVEAQATGSYKIPSDVDTDGDGINDVYELVSQIGVYGGSGLTPFEKVSDGKPDYVDTDTDDDGVPDRNEGDRNAPFITISQATIDASGDADGDGLMDVFDNNGITSLTTGNYYKNVTMSNMGALGDFDGPTPSSSYIQLQQSDASGDRDWRNASILPLQVLNFNVNYQAPIANLKWDAVNELQTNYYEVQVSTNGIYFNSVIKINAKNTGNAKYEYQHSLNNQNSNILYYRIRQVDKDGKYYYTQIAVIKLAKNIQVTAGPNPFVSYVNVYYATNTNEKITITVMDSNGKTVATKQVDVLKGNSTLLLNNLNNVSAGIYYVKVQSSTKNSTITIAK